MDWKRMLDTGPKSLWGNITGQTSPGAIQGLMGGSGVSQGLEKMGQLGDDFLDPYSGRNMAQYKLGQQGAMDMASLQGMQMGQQSSRMGMGGGISQQQAKGAYEGPCGIRPQPNRQDSHGRRMPHPDRRPDVRSPSTGIQRAVRAPATH